MRKALVAHPQQDKWRLGTIFLNAPPPPLDLTSHIRKTDSQYIAGGGFGDVYKCRCTNGPTPQEVAVKALRFRLDEDTEDKSIKMLRRELGIWRRLNHENIVPFLGIAYGFGMSGTVSLVSLWMPNDSLHKYLSTHGGELDVTHRLQILLDIAKGLNYLHSFPIIHGDLNSNNVLLDAEYTARLTDFGYASLAGNIPEALAYLERSTVRPGSLRWIAPEQIDPTFKRTTKSDIYSFGCVALEVLSGRKPWAEVREDAAIVLLLYRGHNPPRPESRTMDDAHWNFIQGCWAPSQKRPGTDTILVSVRRLLNACPPSGALRNAFSSEAPSTQGLPSTLDSKAFCQSSDPTVVFIITLLLRDLLLAVPRSVAHIIISGLFIATFLIVTILLPLDFKALRQFTKHALVSIIILFLHGLLLAVLPQLVKLVMIFGLFIAASFLPRALILSSDDFRDLHIQLS